MSMRELQPQSGQGQQQQTNAEFWAEAEKRFTPLRIYDIIEDKWRPATQADIDQLTAVARAYSQLKRAFDGAHAELRGAVATPTDG